MSTGRILFVDHAAVLGGAELSLLDIAIAFRDRCTVALFEDGPFAERLFDAAVAVDVLEGGTTLRGIKKDSRIPSVEAVFGATRLARELSRLAGLHALIYANSPKSFLVGAVASLIARRPLVWHLRDIIDRTHFSNANIRLLTTVANTRAARVIANSRATADAFVHAGGRPDLVHVVHNGIDAAPFDAVPASASAEVRAALGIPAGAFVVGSFSRLHPWKGQRVVFDALELLPGVHAMIVGGALFSGEEAYEAELRNRAQSPALRGRVHMLGARDDVPRMMAACDVIVHSSIAPEPFGRVIVEALLANRPVIASNDGGVREIVEDGTSARLVPPGDVAALRDAIAATRDAPAQVAAMTAVGAKQVREQFSRDTMIAKVTQEIDTVLTPRAS